MLKKYIHLLLIVITFTACSNEQQPKPTTPLIIKTTNGDVRFMVEVASTPEDLKTGLMHRTNLGFNSGMIFNIYPVRPTAMWMKNTKIPLDMLFVAPDAGIVMIKENATPMSEEHIVCETPIRAVIEINAGQVKRNNIKIGDKVIHPLLNAMVDIKTPGAEISTDIKANTPNTDIKIPNLKVEPITTDTTTPETKKTIKNNPSSGIANSVQVPKPVPAPNL